MKIHTLLVFTVLSFMLTNVSFATYQSINECVIDKYCTNPKKPGCHFKWNKQIVFCLKYYDYHAKKFNYDWDYVRTKQAMKFRINQLKTLIAQINAQKVQSQSDKQMKKKILGSLKNELTKRKTFKIIMKDPNKIP